MVELEHFLALALGCSGAFGVKMAGNVPFSKLLGHPSKEIHEHFWLIQINCCNKTGMVVLFSNVMYFNLDRNKIFYFIELVKYMAK